VSGWKKGVAELDFAADPLTPRPPLPQGGEGEKEFFCSRLNSCAAMLLFASRYSLFGELAFAC
jgi:hypothetical protein